jgi:predicted PhzF superfamily epimerase YddE/YHI9
MGQPIVQVDAFTDRPFRGNPAAVCVLDGPRDEGWMQDVAREMNLSETAFLHRDGDAFRLRWFTPAIEVDLCGHATLAAAHVLWGEGHLRPDEPARFDTRSGRLTAARRGEAIVMDFPAKPVERDAAPDVLAGALGAAIVAAAMNQFDALVEVESEEAVRALRPDFNRLAAVPVRGVIVTSRATTPGFDFVSRFFAPNAGINEDPVTGSAHCFLGPYWRDKLGKDAFRAYQASPRGGEVGVRLLGDRVELEGRAVTVLRGELV